MLYFSGFCLKGEQELFGEFLDNSVFTVAGFSYGAIKAFEYAKTANHRIERLQLISPAFFQNRDEKFKRVQLIAFGKDQNGYIKKFLASCAYPSSECMLKYAADGLREELTELLEYRWEAKELRRLAQKGIRLEVYLGECDQIIDASSACEFFKNSATVYYFKRCGHILREG